ncbi:MAG: DUF885 family protein [Candidatus Absconditabacteria bacterium]
MNYEQFVIKYKDHITSLAISNTSYGIHEKDDLLDIIDIEYINNEIHITKDLLSQLESINKDTLSFDEQIDYELMELELKKSIFFNTLEYNRLFDYEQRPRLGHYLINSLLYLFIQDPRQPIIRLDNIASRIEKMPQVIISYKGLLKKTLNRWKNIEIEELTGLQELFDSITNWAMENKFEKIESMKNNIQTTKESINEYIRFLNNLEEITDFSIGEEKTSELIKLNGIDYNTEQLFQIAKSFYESNNANIKSLKNNLIEKYKLDSSTTQDELIVYIKNLYSVPTEKILDYYKMNQEKITDFLNKTDLFVYPKEHKLLIMKTPSYLIPSIPVGAMNPPAPFENGPKTSSVYLTIDEGRQSDQNSLMITNTMIHEGIPGHHLQFANAYENPSIVRKLYNNNVHAEGRTTYLEGVMTDIGFIGEEIKDEYTLIALSDFARLGARVAIDLYFMTGNEKYLNIIEGYTPQGQTQFDKAKDLLIKVTNFSSARAEGELNWYSQERGYPMCYLVGNKLTWELQNYVLSNFDNKTEGLKFFHKTYLQEGNLPLNLLKKIFEKKLTI